MPTNKRIADLTDYTSVLPYASEMFGVYQPMIGWKSRRLAKRLSRGILDQQSVVLQGLAKQLAGVAKSEFIQCDATISLEVGITQAFTPRKTNGSVLLQSLTNSLPTDHLPKPQEWQALINKEVLDDQLNRVVSKAYRDSYGEQCHGIRSLVDVEHNDSPAFLQKLALKTRELENNIRRLLNEESALAGALLSIWPDFYASFLASWTNAGSAINGAVSAATK